MATTQGHLVRFTVRIDRAMHTEVSQYDADGNGIANIDFGTFGEVPDLANAWLGLDEPQRLAMAPAVEAFLAEQFRQRGH